MQELGTRILIESSNRMRATEDSIIIISKIENENICNLRNLLYRTQ